VHLNFLSVSESAGWSHGTLENSTKVFIMVNKVTVVTIYNNVICDSSYTWLIVESFINLPLEDVLCTN